MPTSCAKVHPIFRDIEPLPNLKAYSLEVFTFRCWIAPVSGARKCPDHGIPFGSWILGIQVRKPIDDEGKIWDVPLVQAKASDALLGPQRPRCRIRFASLAASNCGSTSRFQWCVWSTLWTAQQNMGSSISSSLASQSPNPRGGPHLTERWNQARDVARRIRMGPRAREGSTIWPFCVISWVPAVTSLRAADRAGSSSSRQFSGSTDFAASLGQMLLEASLLSKSCLMASSSCWSTGRTFCLRQRSEHHFTPSQFLAHFFRH